MKSELGGLPVTLLISFLIFHILFYPYHINHYPKHPTTVPSLDLLRVIFFDIMTKKEVTTMKTEIFVIYGVLMFILVMSAFYFGLKYN